MKGLENRREIPIESNPESTKAQGGQDTKEIVILVDLETLIMSNGILSNNFRYS